MKKVFLLCISLILVLSLITGCTSQQQKQEATSTEKPKIEDMIISGGSATGDWVAIGAILSEELNKLYDGYPFTSIPGPGSIGNPPTVGSGNAAVGWSYGPFLLDAYNGVGVNEEAFPNLRAIISTTANVAQVMAADTIEVETIDEIIENRIKVRLGVTPVGQGSNRFTELIFSAFGYENIEDIKDFGASIYISDQAGLNEAWSNRRIDSKIEVLSVPHATINEDLLARSGKLLSLGETVQNLLIEDYGFSQYTIKAGAYDGQTEDINTVGAKNVLFCTKELSDDVVYNIAKTVYESQPKLALAHASYKEFNQKECLEGLGIPLHSGAERYFKDIGLLK